MTDWQSFGGPLKLDFEQRAELEVLEEIAADDEDAISDKLALMIFERDSLRSRNSELVEGIKKLRFGIEVLIEKAKYDEYGSFEDVRNRIIASARELLAESLLPPDPATTNSKEKI